MCDKGDPSVKFFVGLPTLQNASCAEEEIIALQKLRESLRSFDDERSFDEDDFEKEWLQKGFSDVKNPFPTKSPDNCVLVQEDLDAFTFYLFERRFGWSEGTITLDDGCSPAEEHLGRRGSTCLARIQDESKFKGRLNELLDEFLKWWVNARLLFRWSWIQDYSANTILRWNLISAPAISFL